MQPPLLSFFKPIDRLTSLASKSRPNSTSATPVPLPSYAAPPKRPGDAKREPRPKRRHTDSPSVVYSVAEKDIYDFDSADSESRKKEDLETTEHLPNNVKKVPNDMKIHSGPKKQSHKRRKLNLWGDDERDWHSSKKSEEEKLAEALSMYEGDFIPQTWEQFELTASMRRTIYQDVEVGEKRVAVITQYGDGLLYQHYTGMSTIDFLITTRLLLTYLQAKMANVVTGVVVFSLKDILRCRLMRRSGYVL